MHARLSGTRQAGTRRQRGPSVAVRGKPTVTRTVLTARTPSAICPWIPQYRGRQRDKVTHDYTPVSRSPLPRGEPNVFRSPRRLVPRSTPGRSELAPRPAGQETPRRTTARKPKTATPADLVGSAVSSLRVRSRVRARGRRG